ncbi:MAG: CsiV family protein, partial [Saccharospirillum sp.]|uniref:CsiV family protein n=1 Tax=Saccharospirillum sp. TaxID=2033801 RepID=UPI0034A0401F
GRNDVIPIRIDAGEVYGSQHELQGYLELYVERYLHLTTDLQLVRYTQTDNPFRLIDEDASADNNTSPFMGLSLDQQASALGSEVFDTEIITSNNNQYYVATESIEMKQRRRMRSSELHYIDNPELGLLIYIVPIEIDTLDDSNPTEAP